MTTKSRHPDDILWEQVVEELDMNSDPGPSCTGTLIDLSSDSTPVPPPRSKVFETSPIPRPRTFRKPSPADDFELIDYDNGHSNGFVNRQSPDSHLTAILETRAIGFEFDSDRKFREIKLDKGTLLKPLIKPGSRIAQCLQTLRSHSNDLLFTDLMRRNVGTIVRGSNIMRLTDDQTLLLLPATPEERLDLHKDLERFHFVENVKVGDAVSVVEENNYSMYQGRVVEMGERARELGTWYNVEINRPNTSMNVPEWGMPPPPRQIYANAAHIHKPLRNGYEYRERPPPVYQPEVRNIPIKRVETQFNADNTTTQTVRVGDTPNDAFARDLYNWDGDPHTVQEPLREWRGKETKKNCTSRGRTMSNGTQPSRSQSAHTVVCFDKTVSVDDLTKTNGARVGDRCVWHDGHRYNKGTIRFIGHLKGHSSLYGGIEFDEAVGKGTGMFQGETIFQTAEDKAGFVVMNTLEILPRQQEVSKEKQLTVKHKQASAESLSDPVQNGHHAPSVPPRPPMKAEDYLIDSFSVGSYVEVCHLGACRSGVVRWIGDYMSEDGDHLEKHATVELDADIPFNWKMAPYECNPPAYQRAIFVPTTALRRDRMTGPETSMNSQDDFNKTKQDFGSIDSGIETIPCEPWRGTDDLIGRMKGIQGHKNSCYIDATLYAMFVQSTAFDHLLERRPRKSDLPQYSKLVRLLSTEIVYPLRKFHYVRADHVMKIRELFAELMPGVKGLTSEEKDPEEILGQLFGNILKAEPFVQLIGKDNKIDHTFLCPMVVEDWQGGVVTTQHLLERHMRAAGIKFASVPSTLILQLPRYGQEKVFDKILPLERIDITGLVHNAVSPCFGCSKPAEGMCPECFLCKKVFLTEVSYCGKCFKAYHANSGEGDHAIRLFLPHGKSMKKSNNVKLVLSAVLCIETSHYVAFVRSVTGRWLFFDSMADREGLSKGFNVPQVKECDRMSWWLSQVGWERLRDADINGSTKLMLGRGSDVDPLVTRLLSDSYICFYQEDANCRDQSSSNSITQTLGNMMQKIKI